MKWKSNGAVLHNCIMQGSFVIIVLSFLRTLESGVKLCLNDVASASSAGPERQSGPFCHPCSFLPSLLEEGRVLLP